MGDTDPSSRRNLNDCVNRRAATTHHHAPIRENATSAIHFARVDADSGIPGARLRAAKLRTAADALTGINSNVKKSQTVVGKAATMTAGIQIGIQMGELHVSCASAHAGTYEELWAD